LCAGSSSRFDNEDKFLAPINLYEKVTILDIVFKRLQRNARGNTSLPIIVNCNEFNIEKIEKYLKAKNYYGFKA
jgi:molybdopterin-guanine dinucleotide biosynthesis protein A